MTKESIPAAIVFNKNLDGSYYMGKDVTNIRENEDGSMSFTFTNNVDKNYYVLCASNDSVQFTSMSSVKWTADIENLQGKKYDQKIKCNVCKKVDGEIYEPITNDKIQKIDIDANGKDAVMAVFDDLIFDDDNAEYFVCSYYNSQDDNWKTLTVTEINMNDIKQNRLSIADKNEYDLKVYADNSATLSVKVVNESFLNYDRPVGLYTWADENGEGKIQEPRDFVTNNICAYGEQTFTFKLENLERDKEYRATLHYYATEEKEWTQISNAIYRIVVNDETIAASVETVHGIDGVECRVYSINGNFITTIKDGEELSQLAKGLYIIINKNGDAKKFAVK